MNEQTRIFHLTSFSWCSPINRPTEVIQDSENWISYQMRAKSTEFQEKRPEIQYPRSVQQLGGSHEIRYVMKNRQTTQTWQSAYIKYAEFSNSFFILNNWRGNCRISWYQMTHTMRVCKKTESTAVTSGTSVLLATSSNESMVFS